MDDSRTESALAPAIRAGVYACFFLSGATALVLQILWSRQFVTVFGNSAYAISVVLCAFMAGLGVGGWLGGRLADRLSGRLLLYGGMQAGIGLCAAGIPVALAALRRWAPRVALLAPESLLLPGVTRFVVSFAILFVPCLLMGATLPALVRFCAESRQVMGGRIGLLYGLNTLGAAAGCFAAGYWMVDTLGLSLTNALAVSATLLVAAAAVGLDLAWRRHAVLRPAPVEEVRGTGPPGARDHEVNASERGRRARKLLPLVAFVSGLAALSCEVLWFRYLAFLTNVVYSFTNILGVYLLGLAAGSLVYRVALARSKDPIRPLSAVLMLLGLAVPLCFAAGALIYSSSPPAFLSPLAMTALTVLVPTVLMGTAFPLVCAAYTQSVATVGRSVGVVYAFNTLGAIVGSLIPVFLLIPRLGIQPSIFLMAFAYAASGALLWLAAAPRRRLLGPAGVTTLAPLAVVLVAVVVPADLCRRVLLSTSVTLGSHNEILFYREGRTGTATVVRDRISGIKKLYINSVGEVPT
ncbi:MAG: fused MFS/spermidine synthase, partial [Candidatus Brocadiae bacterium]|nr:fused MFS/spermidine synthase [Candidatus Brocadiia bacterium]